MHPYDQMLVNEWEQRCAEEEDEDEPTLPTGWRYTTCPRCGHRYTTPTSTRAKACIRCHYWYDDPGEDQDLADEKAQERRWRVE